MKQVLFPHFKLATSSPAPPKLPFKMEFSAKLPNLVQWKVIASEARGILESKLNPRAVFLFREQASSSLQSNL